MIQNSRLQKALNISSYQLGKAPANSDPNPIALDFGHLDSLIRLRVVSGFPFAAFLLLFLTYSLHEPVVTQLLRSLALDFAE